MHEIYELKEMLMDELREYGKKGEMSSGTLEVVDKLSHAVKSLCYIIEKYENGSNDEYSRREYSYARGRGGNVRRDSMGRYSRDTQEMTRELRELMEDAPDEKTRNEFQRFIRKIEQA